MAIKGLNLDKLDCTELKTDVTWQQYWDKGLAIETSKEELNAILNELKIDC